MANARQFLTPLVGRLPARQEDHLIKFATFLSPLSDEAMPLVHRIKRPAKERHPLHDEPLIDVAAVAFVSAQLINVGGRLFL